MIRYNIMTSLRKSFNRRLITKMYVHTYIHINPLQYTTLLYVYIRILSNKILYSAEV